MASMDAYLDDFGMITVWVNRNFYGGRCDSFYITGNHGNSTELVIAGIEDHDNAIKYKLICPAGLEFGVSYMIRENHGLSVPLVFRLIVQTQQFHDRFTYNGDDLGSRYYPGHTDFALWAPTAVTVMIRIKMESRTYVYAMDRTEKGVWRISVQGDLKRATYTYLIERNGEIKESLDPYGYSSTGNCRESAVIDLNDIMKIKDYPLENAVTGTDAIIYEASVRDMTSSLLTGTREHGTFGALSEESTSYQRMQTGLSYIEKLGVTHVQLMPVTDFITVDEFHANKGYNWGYDPMQYLAPEGSYSTNPDDPYARVRELRTLVTTFHKHNIRVNLDVVFNHVYDVGTSSFDACVPYYYFRYNDSGFLSNGSYCGNDFASEKPMGRNLILFVIKSLMKIYGVDGFRFDLMGILDVDTMNLIRDTARSIKPTAMIYGEGWDMPTVLDYRKKASIMNQNIMPDIGHFNDFFRDMIKGKTSDDQKYEQGYVTGDLAMSFGVLSALAANCLGDPYFKRFTSPAQSINALETHDNSTLWDKMHFCCGNEDRETRKRRQKMMIACTFIAQGIPFIHAGMEYCGTKNDNSNSYNAGDDINRMDWQRALFNEDVIEYTKACIRIRKKYKALRLKEAREIEQFVRMSVSEGGIVFYDVTFEDLETGTHVIRAIINPSYDDKNYVFEPGWTVILDDDGNAHEEKVSEVYVPRLSLIICVR